jgi:hypothetical protein
MNRTIDIIEFYSTQQLGHDICLLGLGGLFDFKDPLVAPLPLGTFSDCTIGTECTVSGYGRHNRVFRIFSLLSKVQHWILHITHLKHMYNLIWIASLKSIALNTNDGGTIDLKLFTQECHFICLRLWTHVFLIT